MRLRASPLISVINDVRLIYCSRKLDYNVSSFFYMHIYSRVALTAAVLHQNFIREEQICSEFGCLICFYLLLLGLLRIYFYFIFFRNPVIVEYLGCLMITNVKTCVFIFVVVVIAVFLSFSREEWSDDLVEGQIT